MELFQASQHWPLEERFALTSQVRRSSRAVCANLAEAWAKRPYPAHFTSKLSDAHAEAEETRVWIGLALDCGYMGADAAEALGGRYRVVIGGLIKMILNPTPWCKPAR